MTSPEITWPEAALTRSHVTGSGHHRNQKSRKWSGAHAHPVPAFFLTVVVVVQNVPLRMSDMATEGNLTPKDSLGSVSACATGICACTTGSCAISTLVGLFHRKWSHQTSPEGLPLELEVTWVPLGCSVGRPRPIYHFLTLSLVICPFPRHKGSAFNNYTTKVCCCRICSIYTPSSLSRPRSHCGGTK